jgi:alkylated DNA repair protein (DNA oxidative demethylase)
MTGDLFDGLPDLNPQRIHLADGAVLLRGFIRGIDCALVEAVQAVIARAPLRHLTTPGGYRMLVAMTCCGHFGWISDRMGYRYGPVDPDSGRPWPAMPEELLNAARSAASEAGFDDFMPDTCLINCYEPGARLSLHQDRHERDAVAPIVSISLGLPAVFLFGGAHRNDRPQRYRVSHGDVAVWGGPARFAFHGIAPLADGHHPMLGRRRINLTFRKVL